MYTNRIVAFIDIMGFKELIFKPASFEEVDEILDNFTKDISFFDEQLSFSIDLQKARAEKAMDRKIGFKANKVNVTFASDCVIWSYELDDLKIRQELVLSNLLSFLTGIQTALYHKGIVIRGGVTTGKLYQHNNKVFGEGLVKAIFLEKKANYPRIVIDPSVFKNIKAKVIDMLFDSDITYEKLGNFYYIDICKYYSKMLEVSRRVDPDSELLPNSVKKYVKEITQIINDGLQHKSFKVKLKYYWLFMQTKKYSNLKPFFKEAQLKPLSTFPNYILFCQFKFDSLKLKFKEGWSKCRKSILWR